MSARTAATTTHVSRRHLVTAALAVGIPSSVVIYYYGVVKPLQRKQPHDNAQFPSDRSSPCATPPPRRRGVEYDRLSPATRIPTALWAAVDFLRLVFAALPVIWYVLLERCGLCPRLAVVLAVRNAATALGPTYVKLAQWAATEFADAGSSSLAPLNVFLSPTVPSTCPLEWTAVEAVLRRDGVLRHLATAERVPLAIGSVAQVHRAILRDSVDGVAAGTAVALKVVHPHVRERVAADIAALSTAVSVLEAVVPSAKFLDLRRALGEFAALLQSQLDLRRECDNLLQFRYNFCEFDGVVFPTPLPTLSTADVLVETFEEGLPLSSCKILPEHRALSTVADQMLAKMLLQDNFVHADLHPGNVLVRKKSIQQRPGTEGPNNARCMHELVVLDGAMALELPAEQHQRFLEGCSLLGTGNGPRLAALLRRPSPPPSPQGGPRELDNGGEAFGSALGEYFAQTKTAGLGGLLRPGDVAWALGSLSVEHRFPLDGAWCGWLHAWVLGDALGRRLSPLSPRNVAQVYAPYTVHGSANAADHLLDNWQRSLEPQQQQ